MRCIANALVIVASCVHFAHAQPVTKLKGHQGTISCLAFAERSTARIRR